MKMYEIFQINSLKDKIKDKKIPIKTAYKFNKLFIDSQEDISFFNEMLQKTIEEYGKKDENGEYILTDDKRGIKIQDEKQEECIERIQELNNFESKKEYNLSFEIEELEGLDLSMQELSILMPFIKE